MAINMMTLPLGLHLKETGWYTSILEAKPFGLMKQADIMKVCGRVFFARGGLSILRHNYW